MTKHAWRLPTNVDPSSVKLVDGVVMFETDDQAAFEIAHEGHTIKLDTTTRRVIIDGQERPFAELRYKLLLEFVKQPEAFLSAEYLYQQVWGGSLYDVKTRAVDFCIYRVRKHLPQGWLQSRRNLGWKLLP